MSIKIHTFNTKGNNMYTVIEHWKDGKMVHTWRIAEVLYNPEHIELELQLKPYWAGMTIWF